MNQVHVVIRGRRTSHSSMESALRAVWWRVVVRRAVEVVDRELIEFCKEIFFVK